MLEDMQVRNFSPHTQTSYLQQVSRFARHFQQSPERLGPEEIRAYQIYLTNEKKLAVASILLAVAALRFLCTVTTSGAGPSRTSFHAPKAALTLTRELLSQAARVLQFLECVPGPKHRAILTT